MAKAATAKAGKGAKVVELHTFVWEGKDRRGENAKGELDSENQNLARAQLAKMGIKVKTIKKKPKPLFGGKGKPITPADIAIFVRQMATMMKAGVPLVQSFELVAEGSDKPAMRKMILGIKADVSAGGSFAEALEKHPKYFDDLFCSLIASGEQAGALETMLDRVATYKEKSEALKAKIKKALTYPISVLVVAFVVTSILLIKVVPTFAEVFAGFGADLPAFTQFVVDLSEVFQEVWYIIFGAIIAAGYAFKNAVAKSPAFADKVDAWMLKAPVFGQIVNLSVIARFARTLATTFAAGVPLVEALDSTAGAAGNAVYRDAIKRIKDDVTGGIPLYGAIRTTGLFPTMLLQMVSIGEESGALDAMLEKVAIHYEQQVDDAVDNLTALMEPMIMSFLGIVVGGLMIAMYMPIFMMGSVV